MALQIGLPTLGVRAGRRFESRVRFEHGQWLLRAVLGGLDGVAIITAVFLAVQFRLNLTLFEETAGVAESVRQIAVAFVAGWLLTLAVFHAYSERYIGAGTHEYSRVMLASAAWAGTVAVACYLAQYELSRGFFVLAMTLGVGLLLVERYVARHVVHGLRRRDRLIQRAILVGAPGNVDAIGATLARERWLGFRVVGAAVPDRTALTTPSGFPVLGATTELLDAVDREEPTAVIFVGGSETPASLNRDAWSLEERGVDLFMVPSMTGIAEDRLRMQPMGGLPLVHVAPSQFAKAQRVPKRLFDLVGSALLLLLSAPVFAAVALAVKLDDGGPVLFRQTRVGRDGAEFKCLKLRTMVLDAEAQEAKLRELHSEPGAVLFKMEHDPRVTRPGRLLRRLSLDQLPQLWNVLRGDMSLVGPRPALPHEVARYCEEEKRRLRVRPGLSGLWQVSGRSNLSRDDATRLDVYYVDNWSMVQDLVILGRTVKAVLTAKGAY